MMFTIIHMCTERTCICVFLQQDMPWIREIQQTSLPEPSRLLHVAISSSASAWAFFLPDTSALSNRLGPFSLRKKGPKPNPFIDFPLVLTVI